MTDKKELLKNIPFSQAVNINELVDYEEGRVVSRTLSSKSHVNITLFAFDKGEEISAHTSPGDAMIQVLDGLSYAHKMGVVHRDVKPENILFTKHQKRVIGRTFIDRVAMKITIIPITTPNRIYLVCYFKRLVHLFYLLLKLIIIINDSKYLNLSISI